MFRVYVKTDNKGRITAINSNEFIDNLEGWTEIDKGIGDKFHHAQTNYFDRLRDENGVCLWHLVDGKPKKRSKAEVEADIEPAAEQKPTLEERLEALENIITLIKNKLGVKD